MQIAINVIIMHSILPTTLSSVLVSSREFICEVQINYPAATIYRNRSRWNSSEGNMRPSNDGRAKILHGFQCFRLRWKMLVGEKREKIKNYLMMFEFEKIELIDGGMRRGNRLDWV